MTTNAKAVQILAARKFKIATGTSRHNGKVKNVLIKWSEFVDKIKSPVVTKETFEEYCKSAKKVKDEIKDTGFFVGGDFENGVRKKVNLNGRSLITLDVDHADTDYEFSIDLGLGMYTYAVYSTHSHSPRKPRLRLVIPLTRTVTAEEYEPIARKLAHKVGIDFFDDTTYQGSRIMYWPSVSADGEFIFLHNEDQWVNPDEILDEYTDWRNIDEWPLSTRQLEAPQKAIRKSQDRAQDPFEKTGILGAFCRSYSISDAIQNFIPDAYESGTKKDRFTFTGGTTVNGAVVYDDKFLFSHHEKDPASGMLVNAFDLVRTHRFIHLDEEAKEGTPNHKRPSFKAMVELANDDPDTRTGFIQNAIEGFDSTEIDKSWLLELETTDTGEILHKLTNITTIIENDVHLKGRLSFNDLMQFPVFRQSLPWRECMNKSNGVMWQSTDDLMLRQYLETKYKVEITDSRANDAVNLVALKNRFHPIKDYLNRLEWDGVPRVETMLHRYLGVKRSAYSDAVSRKVLTAAVARVFNPGCKFDYVLILESTQGQRKSTFINMLAGEWFGDGVETFKGKEAVEGMLGQWIIELGELTAFTRAEIENAKAFISRREDRVRLAYDRRPGVFPRQVIFIGTTNRDDYLKDETGNRRFWPVRCEVERIDIESLEKERDQLWAEAIELWNKGEKLYLDNIETEEQAKSEQKERYTGDVWESTIETWLNEPISKNYWDIDSELTSEFILSDTLVERDRTCIEEIWEVCLKSDISRITQRDEARIRRCMKQISGWSNNTKTIRFGKRYGRIRGYEKV